MDRERHIPAAEAFANSLHEAKTPESRAKWNRAFHTAMIELVAGRKPDAVDYSGLWTNRVPLAAAMAA